MLDTSDNAGVGDAYLFTYKSFVEEDNTQQIQNVLGASIGEEVIEIDSNDGVVQKIISIALEQNSVTSEDQFHVHLNSTGNIGKCQGQTLEPNIIVMSLN